jgi:hypothetical protein
MIITHLHHLDREMKVNLGNGIEIECFQLEDARYTKTLAQEINGVVYSWKTEGRYNWLERGFSVVDVLGLTILPDGLSNKIDLPDDEGILF